MYQTPTRGGVWRTNGPIHIARNNKEKTMANTILYISAI